MQSRNRDKRHPHTSEHDVVDLADTLPTQGSQYVILEDALDDRTLLYRLKRQWDMHSTQLRATVIVPAASAVSVATTSLTDPVTPVSS